MKNINDPIDHLIVERVRVLEEKVPQELEHAFMAALQKLEPAKPLIQQQGGQRNRFYNGVRLIAATILLAVVLLTVYMVFQHSKPAPTLLAKTDEVSVQDSFVENEPATTLMVNPKDVNMTIVWVEKVKN